MRFRLAVDFDCIRQTFTALNGSDNGARWNSESCPIDVAMSGNSIYVLL